MQEFLIRVFLSPSTLLLVFKYNMIANPLGFESSSARIPQKLMGRS